MRPKVVIAVLLAFGILGAMVLVTRNSRQSATSTSAVSEHSSSTTSAPPVESVSPLKIEPIVSTITTSAASTALNVTNHAEYVSKRNAELMALAMNNDA